MSQARRSDPAGLLLFDVVALANAKQVFEAAVKEQFPLWLQRGDLKWHRTIV